MAVETSNNILRLTLVLPVKAYFANPYVILRLLTKRVRGRESRMDAGGHLFRGLLRASRSIEVYDKELLEDN